MTAKTEKLLSNYAASLLELDREPDGIGVNLKSLIARYQKSSDRFAALVDRIEELEALEARLAEAQAKADARRDKEIEEQFVKESKP